MNGHMNVQESAPAPPPPSTFDSSQPNISPFLTLVYNWLTQEAVSSDETWRAAIIMQSFVQASLESGECLDLVLRICKVLNIDGNGCLSWCRTRAIENINSDISTPFESFVIDVSLMKLPPYIEEFVQTETDNLFIYSYHNGQQTYASSNSWYLTPSLPICFFACIHLYVLSGMGISAVPGI